MVVNLSGIQPQGPKHLETLENKTVDGTQNTVRVNRGTSANRPQNPVVGEFYYNTDKQAFEQYTSSGWFNIAQAPGAPTSVVATDQGAGRSFNNGQASVAFTPSTSGGAPSSFIVTPSPATSPATFTGTSSPITVTGLSSSTQYTYTATASGTYGTSSVSTASSGVTATTVPQAPTVVATSGDTSAGISITPGSTGGSAITQYTLISNPSTTTQITPNTSYTFTGLTNGTAYTFFATATNSNGNSLISLASNSIIPSIPSNPAYESIASVRLTSDTQIITLSSIPSTYKHLQLRAHIYNSGDDYVYFSTNLPSDKVYGFAGRGDIGTTAIVGNAAASGFEIYYGGISPTNHAQLTMDFIDYANTGISKTVKQNFGYGRDNMYSTVNQYMYILGSSSAINSITLRGSGSYTMGAGSTVSIYGIRGS